MRASHSTSQRCLISHMHSQKSQLRHLFDYAILKCLITLNILCLRLLNVVCIWFKDDLDQLDL